MPSRMIDILAALQPWSLERKSQSGFTWCVYNDSDTNKADEPAENIILVGQCVIDAPAPQD